MYNRQVSTKSDFIRRLTANGINQLPRFSKDGETIMYIKHEDKQSALGVIRLNYNKTLLFCQLNAKVKFNRSTENGRRGVNNIKIYF